MTTQVGDGTLEAIHAPLHVCIISRHLAIQVVRSFTKKSQVLVHGGEVVSHLIVLLIDARLEEGELLLELLSLRP
jgi:hypothetical protein